MTKIQNEKKTPVASNSDYLDEMLSGLDDIFKSFLPSIFHTKIGRTFKNNFATVTEIDHCGFLM